MDKLQVNELTKDELRRHKKSVFTQGILFVILGVVALLVPTLFSVAFEWTVGWLFLMGGSIQLLRCIQAGHQAPGYWMLILSSLFAMIFGVLLVFRPLEGVIALTAIMAFYFLAEGIVKILFALQLRAFSHWGWILFNGLCSIAISFIVFSGWPLSSMWFIGVLLGVYLIMNGMSFIIMASRAHLTDN
jgi:uncharacterized membrane protein HdeD (DUF308 family)